jgi:hypothetical protein
MERDEKGKFAEGNKIATGRPRTWTEEKLEALAEDLYDWVDEARKKDKLLLLTEWCFDVGIHPQSVPRYMSYSEKFKEAYNWARAWQEQIVAKGALQKKFDARFSQFFLAVNHGWTLDKDRENKEEKQKSNLEKMSDSIHAHVDDEDSENE